MPDRVFRGDFEILAEDVNGREPIFHKLHPDAVVPHRQYPDDAGWDLTIRVDSPIRILPGEFKDLPCDLSVQLPQHTWGMLTGRSSALRKHGLLVNVAVIDEGYRGQLFAGAFNVSNKMVVVENGWRLAQLIVIPRHEPNEYEAVHAERLTETLRANNGFGSTGM